MINKLNLEIIDISMDQVNQFCGNVLQLINKNQEKKIILSTTAFIGFSDKQKIQLSKYGSLLPVNIETIEQIGGGSARCMLAEVFLTKNSRL